MNIRHPHLRLARIVMEAVSPLSVASGRASMRFDTEIVRDANGLPAIPGSSLAGVLRHLHAEAHGEPETRRLFGHAHQREEDAGEDGPSRLSVSWGAVLDGRGRAVEGLLLGRERMRLREDPVLALLAGEAPVVRRRVRLNDRGSADARARGLFDRTGAPRGTRFAFEIVLQGDDPARLDEEWARLRALFAHPAMRLGGGTHAGLGEVRCVRWHEAAFHLADAADWRRFAALGRALDDTQGLEERPVQETRRASGWRRITAHLEPEGGWRIGGMGGGPVEDREGKQPDATPHHEPVIVWDGGRAEIRRRQVVAPASAVKGALAHRVAFHANRMAKRWGATAPVGEDCPEVAELFGVAAGREGAHAGRIFLSDAWLEEKPPTHWLMHTSQDRFTGGVREGLLFGEEVIWGKGLRIVAWMREDISDGARRALEAALDDLVRGWLPLGADAARGHGLMRGEWREETDG